MGDPVLDACCGSRMFWFDRDNSGHPYVALDDWIGDSEDDDDDLSGVTVRWLCGDEVDAAIDAALSPK